MITFHLKKVFPGDTSGKDLPANAGDLRDTGSIPGSGRYLGGGNGNPRWYSCLENTMNRGVWRIPVHGVTKSQTRLKQISTHAYSLQDTYPQGIHSRTLSRCLKLQTEPNLIYTFFLEHWGHY